jgi:hypothetical protein
MKAVVAAREPLYKEIETFVGLREKAFQRFIGAILILPPFRLFPAGQYHV